MNRIILLIIALLLIALPVASQDDPQGDAPLVQSIGFGMSVEETISDSAPFDWWQIEVSAGDVINITIEAYEGLAPLLGILSPGGSLIQRSADGTPNGTLTMRFEFPDEGMYTVVAARVGLNAGTTTGRYVLNVARVSAPTIIDPLFQEVVFRCNDGEAVTAATLEFRQDAGDSSVYRITVIGVDGFVPVIHYLSSARGTDSCISPASEDIQAVYTLPDGTTGNSAVGAAAQLRISPSNVDLGEITLIIGGLDGTPGRYIALVEGFAIETGTDADSINVRLGALPSENTSLLAYMVGGDNRLDPTVIFEEGHCDDAGRRACADVPAINGVGITLPDSAVIGDRFDAGSLISDALPHALTFTSFSNRTTGSYSIMLVGELPPRDFAN